MGLNDAIRDKRDENKPIKKRFIVGMVSAALVAALTVGGSIAYLTDSATIQNQFILDTNLSIDLEEADFDAETAKNLLPAQEVSKDPKVVNSGTVDAYIAATVKVPIMNGKILNEQNKVQEVSNFDLYAYSLGSGWTQYGDAVIKDGFKTYTYVYADKLAGSLKTAALFNSLRVANFTEDPHVENANIDITAYAIQSHGFENASSAFEAYKNQNTVATIAD